jgi:hypothetical protein
MALPESRRLLESAPLWQRAPTRDGHGRTCIDFMLMIPRIGRHSAASRQAMVVQLRDSLAPFAANLVLVDFNQRLGLIWISLKPVPGIARVVMAAVRQAIPEAKLVASQCHPDPAATSRRQRLLGQGRRLGRRMAGLIWSKR